MGSPLLRIDRRNVDEVVNLGSVDGGTGLGEFRRRTKVLVENRFIEQRFS
jgi:hypothetical protein